MTAESSESALVVLSSPYGPIALSVDTLRSALLLAEQIATRTDATVACEAAVGSTKLVDAVTAGKVLGIKPTWLLKRAREKRLPHYRVGKYIRFDLDEVRAAARDGTDR